jgi:hypothetical protein
MSRLCRFLVILILACTVAACSEPEDEVDFMWAETKKLEYKTNDTFVPNDDLKVFTSYQGEEPKELKNLSQATIKIAEPNKYLPDELQEVSVTKGHTLTNEGTYLIIVEYVGRSTISPIKVVSPSDKPPKITITWE